LTGARPRPDPERPGSRLPHRGLHSPESEASDILVLRDPRESERKCSLTPLRGLSGLSIVRYRPDRRLDGGGRIWLCPEGELLGPGEGGRGFLLIDCCWRRVPCLRASVDGELLPRRLPPLVTAYPRRSRLFADPAEGLASVEALYAALALVGRPRPELLAGYPWAEAFLAANPSLPRAAPARD